MSKNLVIYIFPPWKLKFSNWNKENILPVWLKRACIISYTKHYNEVLDLIYFICVGLYKKKALGAVSKDVVKIKSTCIL